jgi:phospholipase C
MHPEEDLLTRRRFVGSAATAAGAVALGGPAEALAKRHRHRSRFDHVVVVMMENRSFDHLLGWVPGADGRQAGLVYTDAAGAPHATHALPPDFQGCAHVGPDHSSEGGRAAYNGGRCDGWLRTGQNDDFSIGYYRRQDLSFLGPAVRNWTTFSRYFSATMAETLPNRIYQHAGQTDRLHNTYNISSLPTIWDRLAAAGLRGRYYYSDLPILALWGTKYLRISSNVRRFFSDCASGRLPHVAFVDPRLAGEDQGVSGDDHPHADIRNGEAFLARVYRAVTTSPAWSRTLLIINYDEWGGFYDHVPPPAAAIPAADRAAGAQDGLRGFRVPCLMVSPYARRGHVASGLYDHTSILRTIEARWKLRPLTVRDASARDLSRELLHHGSTKAPNIRVPRGPFGGPCQAPQPAGGLSDIPVLPGLPGIPGLTGAGRAKAARRGTGAKWDGLREVARSGGWAVD